MSDYDSDDDYDLYDDGEPELVDCPACGAAIYEEAEQCPACGEYIVHGTSPWAGKPGWWVALGMLGIIAMIVALTLS